MTAKVEQSDREFAAQVAEEANPEMCPILSNYHRGGGSDRSPLVQAIASARIAERIVAWLQGLHWTHVHAEAAKLFAQAIEAGEYGEGLPKI